MNIVVETNHMIFVLLGKTSIYFNFYEDTLETTTD